MCENSETIVAVLRKAVDAELERKARLGYNAVIRGENGEPIVVPASELVRKDSPHSR